MLPGRVRFSFPSRYQVCLGLLIFAALLIVAGCNFPGSPQASQQPLITAPGVTSQATSLPTASSPVPTQTPLPLPPALVESDPPPGSEIPLAKPIKLYFNQDMDRASVEAAVSGQPQLSGKFQWQDDSQLAFIPDAPFLPDTQVSLTIGTAARSKRGLALLNPQTLSFRTAGYLRLTQVLPAPAASDVDPASAVVATFNRSIVSLGGDPASLKPAFTIQSNDGGPADGKGEWLNTSTYIFYPQPGLPGGKTYTVKIDPNLASVEGSPLQTELGKDDPPLTWSFTVAMPLLVSTDPAPGAEPVPLDQKISLTFNQAMDPSSVQANFALLDSASQPVQGELSWSKDGKVATFTPSGLLKRGASYTISLSGAAQNLGGTPLGSDFRSDITAVGDLTVSLYNPLGEQIWTPYMPISLRFNAPLPDQDYSQSVKIEPSLPSQQSYLDPDGMILNFSSQLAPMTTYTVTISADIRDRWGGALGKPYVFNLTTAPLDPNLFFTVMTDPLFLTPEDTFVTAQASNLGSVPVTVGSVSLQDLFLLSNANDYGLRQTYQPANAQTWRQALDVPGDRTQEVQIKLNPQGTSLSPGLYYLRIASGIRYNENQIALVVVSDLQVTFKISNTDAFVWAVDLRTGKPVAMAPVAIYNSDGSLAAQGQTGEDGAFQGAVQPALDPYSSRYVVIGKPGEDIFGVAYSYWSTGINPWDFGIRQDYSTSEQKVYLYTDRPVYRPGQTVHYRLVLRQEHNTRYTLPSEGSYTATIYNQNGQAVDRATLPLSAFGTASGDYEIPPESQPGYYRIGDDQNNVYFQVANYRKPEINLQVSFNGDQAVAGQSLSATVNARYFFDAPAGNLPVHWTLTSVLSPVQLPGYQVGPQDTSWLNPEIFNFQMLGKNVASGDAQTGPDGLLSLSLPTEASEGQRFTYTLEVTIQDESGIPVSARAEMDVNPANLYIGIRPDTWTAQVGQRLSFEIQAADLKLKPAGAYAFRGEFRRVEWVRQNPSNPQMVGMPTFVPKYTPVGSTDFTTGEDGLARLQFSADTPGTYQLDVTGEGAHTQVMIWVGGPGQVVWPNEANNKLRLTADQQEYKPGDTAQIFIPNPLGTSALALVTVEREVVMRYQVIEVQGSGQTLNLPIQDADAPNIYVSVTLLARDSQGKMDFRLGYTELKVNPARQILKVSLTSQPDRAGPGDSVAFQIRVTDQDGKPVQGEFSLAVVDLAALALSDPLSPDIVPAFYSEQALGVHTGLSLAAYGARLVYSQPGGGGGGGAADQFLVARENFPDTAYWNPSIVTDANGEAQVSLNLPDNLTTWQVDLRGLTGDTRVGQAQTQLVTSKDLLVRPETPRFLVSGDHAVLAAIVQNNTGQPLQVQVSLQSPGFALDDPSQAAQQVNVDAGGRARVEWWGNVQDVQQVEAVFSARSGNLQDAARPALGPLPVYHYTAPLTFATAGILDQADERLELVSLPRTFQVQGGQLQIDLSPSLSAAMLESLTAMDTNRYDVTEEILSSFLANLEAYQALQKFGFQAPDLQDRLDQSIKEGLSRLLARQNMDGGWGWWTSQQSDPYLTAYVLFGLDQARQNGINIDDALVQKGADYLLTQLPDPLASTPAWQLDRLTFMNFALNGAGRSDSGRLEAIYQVRDQLSPWAQALLALTMASQSPEDARITTLLSDLQSGAVRSATGAHWEDRDPTGNNLISPVTATAMVVYALAQREPASTVLPDAVRYLMGSRNGSGAWNSSYETGWAVLALSQYMQGTGEVGGEFSFSASLNGTPVANGQASAGTGSLPVSTIVPVEQLYSQDPNALLISRQKGSGRLYYSANLQVDRPAESSPAYHGGVSISREYFLADQDCSLSACLPVNSVQAGKLLTVRLTLVVPNAMTHLMVEDRIPAGAEILDKTLKTSQQSVPDQAGIPQEQGPTYDPSNPFADGWGWWNFSTPQIYDNRLVWTADSLPAGTYQLTYTLTTVQPGQYQVIPARAWELYFPDVQGTSAGTVFEITVKP